MPRSTVAADRAVLAVLGLALLGAAGYALAVDRGALPPVGLVLGWAQNLPAAGWFGAMLVLAGLVLVLAGLRALVAHLPERSGSTTLPGSGRAGRLAVELGRFADAAAADLAGRAGVRHASGRAVHDRGGPVVSVDAHVDARASLPQVVQAAEVVRRRTARAAGRELPVRVRLRVGRRRGRARRLA